MSFCRCKCRRHRHHHRRHHHHRRRAVCSTCFTRGRIYEEDGEYRFRAITRCISRRCCRHICRHHNDHVRDGLMNFANDELLTNEETLPEEFEF